MLRSTARSTSGAGVVAQRSGWKSGSARSVATERVEFVVSATEYGSVTSLCSTVPVVGTYTSMS